ncbi:MAG: PepSY domain-containing protein [Nitrospira sp.]|nr:PepSY domain-containing protein [Nitrospira sp.]
MSRGGSGRIVRLAHRWLGMGALGFVLLSVVTGLLWADAKFLYWDDHYKEKVRPLAGPALETATLSVDKAILAAKEAVGGRALVEQVLLRSDFGRLLYELKLRVEGVSTTLLVDARNGERLSPISVDLAPVIAQQYVRTPASVTAVEIERYTPRKKKRAQDAVRVRFDDADATEIVLDRQTGDILEDEGRWRRVHFAVMQLHQLNFFGFEKTLLNIPGVPILLMSLSGCLLWIFHRARARRSKSIASAGDTSLLSARSTGEPKEIPPLS